MIVPESVLDPRRDTDVTASDVPAICGECMFQTRRSVLYKKALRLKSQDNPATLHGRYNEPIALRKFCEATGATVVEYPCEYKRHHLYKWLGGTKDAKVKMPDGTVVVVEIKCPISRPIKDEVPIQYIGQVQTYLYMEPECPYALFVQYKPAGPRSCEKLQITKVDRDTQYMDLRMTALYRFWSELMLWTAYVEKIVTVMQRAWRVYRIKKQMDIAVKNSMVMRLKCAKMVGKMAGFCKRRDAQIGMLVPPLPQMGESITNYVDSQDINSRRGCFPPEAKRPKRSTCCLIVDTV